MTKRKYIIASLLKKMGVLKTQKRLQNAATEQQLLRQAEEILGRNVWMNLKDIDRYRDISLMISNLFKEKNEYTNKITQINEKLTLIKQNQENRYREANQIGHNSEETMENKMLVLEDLKAERSNINDVVANLRMSLEKAVENLNVISKTGASGAEINIEKASIERLKSKLSNLEGKRTLSDEKLAKQEVLLAEFSDSTAEKQISYKALAAENSEIMNSANKAMSSYYTKIGILENKLTTLFREVGQSISDEYYSDRQCRNAVKKKSNLCKIIQSIRTSIAYNLKLADL